MSEYGYSEAEAAVPSLSMTSSAGLDMRALDRARVSRDARFDGKFFIAVTSTRIYCRPICPVRSPKRTNIRYYASAAAAAEAGYRPCLRCRPEAAPGTPAWNGTSAVVKRALRLIDDGVLDSHSITHLADKVGVGPRHLLRLFMRHVGASPVSLARTRRLHFAKRLLDETNLRIKEIAVAAGFGSVRRFNSEFLETYKRAPRELRRQLRLDGASDPPKEVTLRLAFRPPYDFAQVLRFFAARAIPGIETVDETGYARTISSDEGGAIVRVRFLHDEDAIELKVTGATAGDLFKISSTARRAFDVSADPKAMLETFRSDALLGPLLKSNPGLRVPGAWDPFECVIRTIIGQQVTVAGARTLATRIVERVGKRIKQPAAGLTHLFPTAKALASADLNGLGLTNARIAAIQGISRAVVEGSIDFSAPVEEVITGLTRIAGVGQWTAQYVALRALAEPDAFPSSDLVLRQVAGGGRPISESQLEALSDAWRPWRAYAAQHLWCGAAALKKTT